MADDRTYIRVHDGMPDHPKIDPLSDTAFRLLITSWCWCSRHLTDGRMPKVTWAKRGTPKARRELLAVGLVTDDGSEFVQFHDYLEHQRSAEQVAAMKEQRRAAGRAGGLARAKRPAKQVAKQNGSKTQASTETDTEQRTTSSVGTRKRAAPASAAPDIFPITDAMAEWGRQHASHVANPQAETQRFLDHHRAKGTTFKDWTAAWRKWMGKAEEYETERGPRQQTLMPAGPSRNTPWFN